jgi:hypothetical protein
MFAKNQDNGEGSGNLKKNVSRQTEINKKSRGSKLPRDLFRRTKLESSRFT